MDDQVFDNQYTSKEIPYLDKVTDAFNIALSHGYQQIVAYFSGGGDSGAIDQFIGIKGKYFDEKYTNSTLNNYDLCRELKFKSIEYTEGSMFSILQLDDVSHNMITCFENFLYNCCLNVDFNGEIYSNGSILIDLATGIIVTKTVQEVKSYEELEPLNIKINSSMINAYISDSSLIDEL
jgi:hypothetical protein